MIPRAPSGPTRSGRDSWACWRASEQAIEEAARRSPKSEGEFDCIRRDVEAVAWLARHYRNRILAAMHFQFYRRTFHHPELTAAYDYLQRAADAWDRLSSVTEEHFGYVPETIRMGVARFRWREEGRHLGVDLNQINNLEQEFFQVRDRRRVTIGHVPPLKARPGQALPLTVTCIPSNDAAQVFLFYRNSRRAVFTTIALRPENRVERTWRGEIPAEEVLRTPSYHEWVKLEMQPAGGARYGALVPLTPEGILYYFEAIDEDGNAAHYPDFLKETPYFVIEGWAR